MAQLNFCLGQSEQENLNKYFAYRNWFKMRFIKIGPQPGESLSIENRTIEPMQGYYFLAGSFSISIGQAGL